MRGGQDPPCFDCIPALLPENEEAAQVYTMVCNQAVTAGMSGAILDINFDAVLKIMDLYQVTDRENVFSKVVAVFRELVVKRQRHSDGENQKP